MAAAIGAAEKSKDQLLRDFWGCSIFDFCNSIPPESGHRPAGISEARGRPALRDDWGQNRADQPRQT